MKKQRKYVLWADNGQFTLRNAKTGTGLLLFGTDPVVAVIDNKQAGKTVAQALDLPTVGPKIPVVRDLLASLDYDPDTILISTSPTGGRATDEITAVVRAAIKHKLDVVAGLHDFFSLNEIIAKEAKDNKVEIWDARKPPTEKVAYPEDMIRKEANTVLFVGSDCASGKMSTALMLHAEAQKRQLSSSFLATGQTGIVISGGGLPLDAMVMDDAAPWIRKLIIEHTNKNNWVFVEGQGALNNKIAARGPITLIQNTDPKYFIFCHKARATTTSRPPHFPMPPLEEMIEMNHAALNWVNHDNTCKTAGIALITYGLSEKEAQYEIAKIEKETGITCTDPLRYGVKKLMDSLINLS